MRQLQLAAGQPRRMRVLWLLLREEAADGKEDRGHHRARQTDRAPAQHRGDQEKPTDCPAARTRPRREHRHEPRKQEVQLLQQAQPFLPLRLRGLRLHAGKKVQFPQSHANADRRTKQHRATNTSYCLFFWDLLYKSPDFAPYASKITDYVSSSSFCAIPR